MAKVEALAQTELRVYVALLGRQPIRGDAVESRRLADASHKSCAMSSPVSIRLAQRNDARYPNVVVSEGERRDDSRE